MATKNIGEQVEYIETDGNCEIPTDIGWGLTSGCQISIYRPVASKRISIFWANGTSDNSIILDVSFTSSSTLQIQRRMELSNLRRSYTMNFGSNVEYVKIWIDNTKEANQGTYYEKNTTTPYTLMDLFQQANTRIAMGSSSSSSATLPAYLNLFKSASNQAGMRFYGAVLWDGNDGTTMTNPSHILIPWRDASGVYSIIDAMTRKIYYNTGTGTLTGA